MKIKIYLIIVFIFASILSLYAQNIDYAKELIKQLASPSFHGRGYEFKGDSIASQFIGNQLKKNNIKAFDNSYFQDFSIQINTFPGEMELYLNKTRLIPGMDFIVFPSSPTLKGKYEVQVLDAEIINSSKKYNQFLKKDFSDIILIIDTTGVTNQLFKEHYQRYVFTNLFKAKAIIEVKNSLVFGSSTGMHKHSIIHIDKEFYDKNIKKVKVDIENLFIQNYQTTNVIGYIEGQIDTFIVFSAHYDHLGRMGRNTYFPGAHDNASGVALLLDLAQYYSKSKPHYSIAFMFFSGEESGLLGSRYYTMHPLFPLKKIKFLFNLDLVGSGEDGIQIVNSTVFKKEYELLKKINTNNNYLKQIKQRGPAANSDHYFFYINDVPSYFIYSLGSYKEYHNIYDKAEGLPLSGYNGIFKLLVRFVDQYH